LLINRLKSIKASNTDIASWSMC